MFFWNALAFFDDPADVGNLIFGSSAFSKTSLNIRKFTVHVLLKPGLENFEYYFTSLWDECNCAVVWAFFGIAFLWEFLLSFHLVILPGAISPLFCSNILGLGSSSFSVISFCLLYCSLGSQGKNAEVVCHSLLQWTMFCQNSPPWPVHLGWSYMASFLVSLS